MNQEDLAKLAYWWWSISAEEREWIRKKFIYRFNTDPVFHNQVMKLVREEREHEQFHRPS